MSKGTRALRLVIPTLLLYIFALFHIIPFPFVSSETIDLILPVVSLLSSSSTPK